MKILVTSNVPFEFTPPADVEVVPVNEDEAVPAEHLDADAAIVQGWASAVVDQLAREATQLRWVQTLAAGPDGVLAAGFDDDVVITNGRGLHDRTVAETAVMLALTGIYRVPAMLAAQRDHRWEQDEFGSWRPLHTPERLGRVVDTNVLVWGFGSIGEQVARNFTALGARVRGIATSAGERGGFPVHTEDDLPRLLPETDILVMVLPTSDSTHRALDAEKLALLPSRAWVVNVGRGSTVDQDALLAALQEHRIGGAALDVVAPEPYPADGPLWEAPNCIITPHMAGGVAHGSDELINANLQALREGRELRNVVAR